MKIIYLYLKESPLGLKYLGITVKNPYEYKGSGKYWKNHLKFHNFTLFDVSTDILLETIDKDIIKFWGLYYSKLWNIVDSNDFANLIPESGEFSCLGAKASDETKRKQGLIHKGKKYRLGHKASPETKLKMSEQRKGEANPFYNKNHTEESKLKIGKKNKDREMTFENRINLTKSVMKPIVQYDLEMNFIKEWDCARYAAKELDLIATNITQCCKGKAKTTGGFKWKYKNEEK